MRWLVITGCMVILLAGCGQEDPDGIARAACLLPEKYPIDHVTEGVESGNLTYWFDGRFVTLTFRDDRWVPLDHCQS